jgi:hypothetical protein
MWRPNSETNWSRDPQIHWRFVFFFSRDGIARGPAQFFNRFCILPSWTKVQFRSAPLFVTMAAC